MKRNQRRRLGRKLRNETYKPLSWFVDAFTIFQQRNIYKSSLFVLQDKL